MFLSKAPLLSMVTLPLPWVAFKREETDQRRLAGMVEI